MLKIKGSEYGSIMKLHLNGTITTNHGCNITLPSIIYINDLVAIIKDMDSLEDTLNDPEPINKVSHEQVNINARINDMKYGPKPEVKEQTKNFPEENTL